MYELRSIHLCVGDPSLCRTELKVEARGPGTKPLGHWVSVVFLASHKLETQTWPSKGHGSVFVKVRGQNLFYLRVFNSIFNFYIVSLRICGPLFVLSPWVLVIWGETA